jgi:hypothetical protein
MTIPEVITSILIVYWFARLMIPVIEANDAEKEWRREH